MRTRLRIALTGATGFLGRHVVARLSDKHDLVCITRSGSAPDGHRGAAIDIGAGDGDGTLDALQQAFSGCDVVVHAAGRVSHSSADAQALFDVHVTGTERVIAAARSAGVPRVVYIGTSGTVAVSRDPVVHTEADVEADGGTALLQTITRWPYYRTKWLAEDAALAAHGDGLDVVLLNPGLLLGPGDDPTGAATKAVRVFLDDGMPVAPAGGPSFVDVRDVAAAVEAALTRGSPGRRMLLGGANWPWSQLFGTLARITDRRPPLASAPGGLTRFLARNLGGLLDGDHALLSLPFGSEELDLASHYWYASWDRAAGELGFAPRDPVQTLEDTTADILERRRRGFMLYGRPA